MKLSIITTLYYSQEYIDEFYERMLETALKITDNIEFIFVNDGSPDDSLEKALNLLEKDNRVTVIDLSKNFGHHKAIMTGVNYASGELIMIIDADLEEPPELLEEYWHKMNETDADVVYGIQKKRKGEFFERMSGKCAHYIIKFLSDENIPMNVCMSRLMNRKYVDSLKKFKEKELYIVGIFHSVGFTQEHILVEKTSKGKTTYTFAKKMYLLMNAITSFSNKPLVYIFNIGLSIFVFTLIPIVYLIYRKLMFDYIIVGWTSLMVAISFFSSLIIMFLGIIGIYLSKIFIEIKDRPYTIINNIYSNE